MTSHKKVPKTFRLSVLENKILKQYCKKVEKTENEVVRDLIAKLSIEEYAKAIAHYNKEDK